MGDILISCKNGTDEVGSSGTSAVLGPPSKGGSASNSSEE